GQRRGSLPHRSGRLLRGPGGGSRLFGNVRRIPLPLLRRLQRSLSPCAGVFREKAAVSALLSSGPPESVRRILRPRRGPHRRTIRRLTFNPSAQIPFRRSGRYRPPSPPSPGGRLRPPFPAGCGPGGERHHDKRSWSSPPTFPPVPPPPQTPRFPGGSQRVPPGKRGVCRSEEHTSELQSRENLVCRLLLEKKKNTYLFVSTCHR